MLRLILLFIFCLPVFAQQHGVPVSDISDTDWSQCSTNGDSDADHFDELDEDESSYDDIVTSWTTSTETALVSKIWIWNPQSASTHTLYIRARKTSSTDCESGSSNGEDRGVTLTLKQGVTTIASVASGAMNAAYSTYSANLTAGEISSITDYTDLTLEVVCNDLGTGAGRRCNVTGYELHTPAIPTPGTAPRGFRH